MRPWDRPLVFYLLLGAFLLSAGGTCRRAAAGQILLRLPDILDKRDASRYPCLAAFAWLSRIKTPAPRRPVAGGKRCSSHFTNTSSVVRTGRLVGLYRWHVLFLDLGVTIRVRSFSIRARRRGSADLFPDHPLRRWTALVPCSQLFADANPPARAPGWKRRGQISSASPKSARLSGNGHRRCSKTRSEHGSNHQESVVHYLHHCDTSGQRC